MPPDLQLLIEGLALRRPPPTIATVHRQAAEVARAQGWPAPGYAAVYDVVQSIDPAMATLAHEGSKRYKEVFDLVHRREAAKPNEILLRCSPAHRPALPLDPVRMFLKGLCTTGLLLHQTAYDTGSRQSSDDEKAACSASAVPRCDLGLCLRGALHGLTGRSPW